jgi:hypothetical protein
VTGPRPPDPATLWPTYARHAALYMGGGPSPTFHVTDRFLLATSGAQHVDLNQGVLFGDATESDARDVVDRVLASGLPVLFGCSSVVTERAAPTLLEAGFQRMPTPEALFWSQGAPSVPDASAFDVRRVENPDEVAAMQAIFQEAHGYEPELTDALFGRRLRTDDSMTGWLAWDGDEAVSFAIVTRAANTLSLWVVMTPARHRRRGAARMVVVASLAAVSAAARAAGTPIEHTLFWSSPAGRPLYEAMGFLVADTVDAFVLGATEADLVAVGASVA